jgi:hypothetical protein
MVLLIGMAIGIWARTLWRALAYIAAAGAILGLLRWNRMGFVASDLGIPMSTSAVGSVGFMVLLVGIAACIGWGVRRVVGWISRRL